MDFIYLENLVYSNNIIFLDWRIFDSFVDFLNFRYLNFLYWDGGDYYRYLLLNEIGDDITVNDWSYLLLLKLWDIPVELSHNPLSRIYSVFYWYFTATWDFGESDYPVSFIRAFDFLESYYELLALIFRGFNTYSKLKFSYIEPKNVFRFKWWTIDCGPKLLSLICNKLSNDVNQGVFRSKLLKELLEKRFYDKFVKHYEHPRIVVSFFSLEKWIEWLVTLIPDDFYRPKGWGFLFERFGNLSEIWNWFLLPVARGPFSFPYKQTDHLEISKWPTIFNYFWQYYHHTWEFPEFYFLLRPGNIPEPFNFNFFYFCYKDFLIRSDHMFNRLFKFDQYFFDQWQEDLTHALRIYPPIYSWVETAFVKSLHPRVKDLFFKNYRPWTYSAKSPGFFMAGSSFRYLLGNWPAIVEGMWEGTPYFSWIQFFGYDWCKPLRDLYFSYYPIKRYVDVYIPTLHYSTWPVKKATAIKFNLIPLFEGGPKIYWADSKFVLEDYKPDRSQFFLTWKLQRSSIKDS